MMNSQKIWQSKSQMAILKRLILMLKWEKSVSSDIQPCVLSRGRHKMTDIESSLSLCPIKIKNGWSKSGTQEVFLIVHLI
jgi:hypothetical protein